MSCHHDDTEVFHHDHSSGKLRTNPVHQWPRFVPNAYVSKFHQVLLLGQWNWSPEKNLYVVWSHQDGAAVFYKGSGTLSMPKSLWSKHNLIPLSVMAGCPVRAEGEGGLTWCYHLLHRGEFLIQNSRSERHRTFPTMWPGFPSISFIVRCRYIGQREYVHSP